MIVLPSYMDHHPVACGEEMLVRNPANLDEVVGGIGEASSAVIDQTVQTADKAYQAWRRWEPARRAECLRQAAERIAVNAERLASVQTREHGKVYAESVRNVRTTVRILRYYADLAETFPWEWEEASRRGPTRYTHDPVGVTAVIVPWNSPLTLGFLMVVPAVLAGNTVVVKPASYAPLALGHALQLLAEALPAGVVNWVTGAGGTVGEALADHPLVQRIAFTGSTETGRSLMAIAARRIKNISLELGGNDPAIVLDDMPLDDAVFKQFVEGVFTSSGQICLNIKRIYVHDSLFQRFVDGFGAHVDRLVIGNPLDAATTMGPINNGPQWKIVSDLVDDARGRGGRVLKLGCATPWVSEHRGYFMSPTVITGTPWDAPIMLEEQFGPAIPIVPYTSWEQVRDWANGTEFGLCSSIWTGDIDRGMQLGRELESGTTFFNTHRAGASDIDQAFGGVKQSGLGRGHGHWAVEEATAIHAWIRNAT